jgi:hypothetical protein
MKLMTGISHALSATSIPMRKRKKSPENKVALLQINPRDKPHKSPKR